MTTGRWRTTFHNTIIESINTESLHRRYQQFLDSLEGTSTKILSVNYQVATYRLEDGAQDGGISFSVLVTYSVQGWVEEPITEHGLGEVKNK